MTGNPSFPPARRRHRGSALISTLLVLLVLTIIVIAFLQSMAIERETARSYKNRLQAELAAQAGIAEAMATLRDKTAGTRYRYIIETINPDTENEFLQISQLSPVTSDADAVPTVINSTPLASLSGAGASQTARLTVASSDGRTAAVRRQVAWKPLSVGTPPVELARFAYWTEEAGAKQDLLVHSGDITRGMGADLREVRLLNPKGDKFTPLQTGQLADYQISKPQPDRKTIPTPKSVDQIIDPPVAATEHDYTIGASTALLTPEGKPRLNLTRLKCYIDGGTFQEVDERNVSGESSFNEISYPGLSLTQGENQPRFELIKQLLNENGDFPAEKENPWGFGNLEIVRKLFPPASSGSNVSTQARQIVANIIDYIDEDLIPTTDGLPGPAQIFGTQSGGQVSYNLSPSPSQAPLPVPTVLGVEARYDSAQGGVIGHPYITYLGQGFIFNFGNGRINSTRVLGWLGLAYPWDANTTWRRGGIDAYQAEVEFQFDGTVENGIRGNAVAALSGNGYFQSGWLSQKSGFYSDSTNGIQDPSVFGRKNSYTIYPRLGAGGFDLSNGFYTINQPNSGNSNFAIRDLRSTPRIVRLIYKVAGQRYLVQTLADISAGGSTPLTRNWTPGVFNPSNSQTQFKIGGTYGQTDWLFVGDPRLNFRADGWRLADATGTNLSSGSGWVGPNTDRDFYAKPVNSRKDPLQGLDADASKWFTKTAGLSSHLPLNDPGRPFNPRPSPDLGAPAMQSYSELGFIHAGRPWQTLTLFNDPARFPDQSAQDRGDWRILDYIDLGRLPRHLNTGTPPQRELLGRINVNTGNRNTLKSLFADVPLVSTNNVDTLVTALLQSPRRPFVSPALVFADENLKNEGTSDSLREDFVGRIYPALATHSQRFTIYSTGQTLRKGSPLATVTLIAEVELRYDPKSGRLAPVLLRKAFQ